MRFISCILAVLVLVASLPLPVMAEAPPLPDLEEAIIDAYTYGKELVLSDYAISPQTLVDTCNRLYYTGRLPWYADADVNYTFSRIDGTVITLTPTLLDPEVYDYDLYERRAAEILAECTFPGMAPWQMALSVHDYLTTHTVYDSTLEADTGYDLLVHGTATCAGYADGYLDLMRRCGIPCHQVISEEMVHGWNLVELEGKWYHVDATWDDPTPDFQGFSRYTHFLVSDEEISQGDKPHKNWETQITCDGDGFTDAFFRSVTSPICWQSSQICYYLRYADCANTLYRYDLSTDTETALYTHPTVTVQGEENRYSIVNHGGLSLRDGRLYFATLDGAVSVTTEGTDLRREYEYSTDNGRFVMGCFAGEDTLFLTISDTKNNTEADQVPLPAFTGHTHSYESTPEAPTCTQPGWLVFTCQCGVTYRSGMTVPTGHSLERESWLPATPFHSGYTVGKCRVCGETDTTYTPRFDIFLWIRQNVALSIAIGIGIILLVSFTPVPRRRRRRRQ